MLTVERRRRRDFKLECKPPAAKAMVKAFEAAKTTA